jgi:hypothetical protein
MHESEPEAVKSVVAKRESDNWIAVGCNNCAVKVSSLQVGDDHKTDSRTFQNLSNAERAVFPSRETQKSINNFRQVRRVVLPNPLGGCNLLDSPGPRKNPS